MSEPTTPAPETPPAAPPAADPAAPAAPAPSRAKGALEAFRAKRAAAPAANAVPATAPPAAVDTPAAPAGEPAAPVIPPDVADAAKRWQAHVKAEGDRIAAAAAALSEEDQALIAGEPDIARKAALLARFSAGATEAPAKQKAPPRAAGGPPAASAVDYASTLKDPRAMEEAKAKDPKGYKAWFSRATAGTASRSTLDRGRA